MDNYGRAGVRRRRGRSVGRDVAREEETEAITHHHFHSPRTRARARSTLAQFAEIDIPACS